MMPVGPILLTILLVMIYFGLADRVLGLLRLTVRQALLLVGAMLLGSFFDMDLAPGLTINLGGGVIPLGVAIYLIIMAGTALESARAVAATLVTAAAVYLVGRWFPPGQPTELNLFLMDAQYLYGLTAGLVGYSAGRSRRSAFCAGVLGVVLADLVHYVGYAAGGIRSDLAVHVGGGGFWDTTMVAGVLALLVAEIIGDSREALEGESTAGGGRPWPD